MRVLLAAAVLLLAVPAATATIAGEEAPQESPFRIESCDRGGTSLYVGTVTVFECALDGVLWFGPCPYGSGTTVYVVGEPFRLCFEEAGAQSAEDPYVRACDGGGVEAGVSNLHLHCTQVNRVVEVYPCYGPDSRGFEVFVRGNSLGCIY